MCWRSGRSLRDMESPIGSSRDKHLDAAVLLPSQLAVIAGNRKDLSKSLHLQISGVALCAERDQLLTHGIRPLASQLKIGARAADIIGEARQQQLRRRRGLLQIARKPLNILTRLVSSSSDPNAKRYVSDKRSVRAAISANLRRAE